MKVAQLSGLVALGLLFVSPAAASVCRHQAPSSPATPSSAAPSASPIPTPPACGTNYVTNGDFSNNTNFWTITGQYASTLAGCGIYANCMNMYFSSGSVSVSQDIPTVPGFPYTIRFTYYSAVLDGLVFSCSVKTGSQLYSYLPGVSNSWQFYSDSFMAAAYTSYLNCSISSSNFNQFELTNVFIGVNCQKRL